MNNVAYREKSLGQRTATDFRVPDYLLIARHANGRTNVLVIETEEGERLLPVFSAGAEAEMFVWLGSLGSLLDDAWYPRGTSNGELLAMMIGPRRSVGRVALDPSPQIMTAGGSEEMELVCLSRKEFVERLLSERARSERYADR